MRPYAAIIGFIALQILLVLGSFQLIVLQSMFDYFGFFLLSNGWCSELATETELINGLCEQIISCGNTPECLVFDRVS